MSSIADNRQSRRQTAGRITTATLAWLRGHGVALTVLAGLLLIGSLALTQSGLAILAFARFGAAFNQVANTNLPNLLTASRLSELSQSLVARAPELAAAGSQTQREGVADRLNERLASLAHVLNRIDRTIDPGQLQNVRSQRDALAISLRALNDFVRQRIDADNALATVMARLPKLAARVRNVADEALVAVGDGEPGAEAAARPHLIAWSAAGLECITMMLGTPAVDTKSRLERIEAEFETLVSRMEVMRSDLPAYMRLKIDAMQDDIVQFGSGAQGIFQARQSQIEAGTAIQTSLRLIDQNIDKFLASVSTILGATQQEISGRSANLNQAISHFELLIIVTSLLCVLAGAAIFAYVRRAVITRLKRVQEYMRAEVEGRPAEISTKGADEIAEIATATRVFVTRIANREAALQQRTVELSTALDQQTATSEILQVISASPGNLMPVFDAILEKAHRLCGADVGTLGLYDGAMFRSVAMHGFPKANAVRSRQPWVLNTYVEPLIHGERLVHVTDLETEDPEWDNEISRSANASTPIRTGLWLPLRKDGMLQGYISLFRSEVRPFSDKEISLLENFAAQAVLAMDNARLLTEQREALAQQTATAEVLQVINSSPGDLAPVFDTMLENAMRLCEATFAQLDIYSEEGFRTAAMRNVPAPLAEFRTQRPPTYGPGTIPARLVAGEPVVHVADLKAEGAYRDGEPNRRALVDLGGARTALAIPLQRDGALLGELTAYRNEVRPFTDKQIALLQNFAAQAVIAIDSARLLDELRQRTEALARRNSEYGERIEQQTATIDVLEAMSASSGDAQPVFQVIVERARAVCHADDANLALVESKLLHLRATSSATTTAAAWRADSIAQFPRPVDATSLFGRAILAGDAVQTPDVSADLQHLTRTKTGVATVRAVVAVPLLRAGTPIGAIVLSRNTPGEFSATQVELLRTFAEQAVIAISSAETFKQLQRRTADLTRSVAELQALEEVMRAVNSSLELETVLSTVISRAAQLSDADEGTIYEFNDAEQVFVPRSAYGMTTERVAALRDRRIRIGETPLGSSAAMRAPLHIPDLTQTLDIDGSRVLVEEGIHALLAVPLLRDEKVLGGLVIRRRAAGGFGPTVPTLLQTFAGQCVLAIENARLFLEARRARVEAETTLADLRRTQDRLVQSEKMASLGQLTAGIAHEIKNPLNFVNNFSELSADLVDELREAVAPGRLAMADNLRTDIDELTVTLRGNLEKIAEHGRRADSIVKNMLLHSRSGPGEHQLADLNATVEEALNLAYHGARAATPGFNITMETRLDPRAGRVEMYPQEITRVLLNLISNGFYAAHKRAEAAGNHGFRPTLWLTTRDLGNEVEIRVRDNGTGISETVRDKIFEPFFTTKPAGEGTGLGLSISYDIIARQHGGSITVESVPGSFTELTVRLPRQ